MARRRAKRKAWVKRSGLALAVIPALYLLAALLGSLIPVNTNWEEPDEGITVYLANTGVHSDIVMPVRAQGLDWAPLLPKRHFASPNPGARWVAFGSGEERVYLNTPTWWDLTPRTLWSALTGGRRVMRVEWVEDPASYVTNEVRLRPEEYRRLWAAIRADFPPGGDGKPQRIDAPGYGCCDAFYRATGRATALYACNNWTANRLRQAGVETSLWPPFVQGLLWRYRKVDQST